jgi:hypothetical protein
VPASWVIERIHPFAQDVGSVVPEGFEAYARVFHPAWSGGADGRSVRWAKIAASTGRVLHATAQWPHIAFLHEIHDINELQDPPTGAPWDSPPEEGCLSQEIAERLIERLTPFTSSPYHCFFAVWEGWGDLRSDAEQAPSFELPQRRYFLFEGPVGAATETFSSNEESLSAVVLRPVSEAPAKMSEGFPPPPARYQSAALWWPDDQSWCVATEVDLESTYIGGSRDCIEAILADSSLETLEVHIEEAITWESDTVNPNPLRLRR